MGKAESFFRQPTPTSTMIPPPYFDTKRAEDLDYRLRLSITGTDAERPSPRPPCTMDLEHNGVPQPRLGEESRTQLATIRPCGSDDDVAE